MSTTVYLIRHCKPNFNNHDDVSRELSTEGLQHHQLIIDYFSDKTIDIILSSPYKRSIDTISPLAQSRQLSISRCYDFRERKIDNTWIEDFTAFSKQQWADFSYKLTDGESLREVQVRTISALKAILHENSEKTIVISSHGTAISTIINYYQNTFSYSDFKEIKQLMPFILKMTFDQQDCLSIELYNPFTNEKKVLKP